MPAVIVTAPVTRAPANVTVPVVLRVNGPIVLPFGVIVPVPVPNIDNVNTVYVPLDDNVKFPYTDKVVDGRAKEVVPKFIDLYLEVVVIVAIDAPVENVRFTALVSSIPSGPKVNVLVLLISATVNPPVPVQLKPVALDMFNTTVAAVV